MGTPLGQFGAWGKLSRDGTALRTHALVDHMFDVAACFVALAGCRAIRRALHSAAQRELDVVDIARLAVLTFLHDLGKANAGFQSRRWLAPQQAPTGWPTSPYGHGPEGWALMTGSAGAICEQVLAGLPLDDIASWGAGAADALLHASMSHHGRPLGDEPGKQGSHIWQPVCSTHGEMLYDPALTIAEIGRQLRQGFPAAFSDCQRALPECPAFVHLYAGFAQLADWLGSDTRPGFFEYSVAGEQRRHTAHQRAAYAVRSIGLKVDSWRDALASTPPTFETAFAVAAPRPMQRVVTAPVGGLVILEAETGSGKTEAALWRFLDLFQRGEVDSLFFALPTRVAATQLYERICQFVARVWPEDGPVVVRALPGYEAADGHLKTSLPDYKVQWPDNPADAMAHRRWVAESPKRFLAATIAVGTIDQALLATLQVRHAHLRHALLSRSLLVVDEVHASDAYMTVLLEQLLKAHQRVGGHTLLLSATLGAAARTRYLNTSRQQLPLPVPPLETASAFDYPVISHSSAAGAQFIPVRGNPRHKIVHWEMRDWIDQPECIAALAMQAATQGARVLVVRNTVPAATATLLALEALHDAQHDDYLFRVNGVSTLHHSRFSRQDRPLLDHAVQTQLGKQREQMRGRIVIGSQTLEQSLDIDADLLITDLCPMDVLLQRLGRLHRHERTRPAGYGEARAWVLTPEANDLTPMLKRARNGLGRMRDGGGVYPDLRILEATRQLIAAQACRDIPGENRFLVEHATHPHALRAIEMALGGEWQKNGQAIEGDTGARRGLAYLHAIDYNQPFADSRFPDSDQKIATRLGAADRLIDFAPPQPGPFGKAVSQIALRFHQLPADLNPDAQPTDIGVIPGGGGFEFALGTARYRYSRLGLTRLKDDDPPLATSGKPQ
jgi:CRISPR-associated endonuclease/helicase Cas3